MRLLFKVSCVAIISLQIVGCGQSPTTVSKIQTVDIGQTPVKSQGQVGFCWSYATIGLLESLMKKKTGVSVDLSEEALGYYRMAEELYALSSKFEATELSTSAQVAGVVFEGLQGWDLSFNPVYHPDLPRVRNSMQLIEAYGTVPESVWTYKFTTGAQEEQVFESIFADFSALMLKRGRGQVTRDMVFDLLAKPQAFGSRPPTEFTYLAPNGHSRLISAVNFASDIIGFSKDDYTNLIPDTQIGYPQLVQALKLTLARGINVPFSYTIFKDQFDSWDASYQVLDPNAALVPAGGHAVIVTDFVNNGGRPGLVSPDVLAQELAKSSDDLQFVVIKNSWGTGLQSPLLPLAGYHTIHQSYLRALTKTRTDISIIVPRDIAMQVRYN